MKTKNIRQDDQSRRDDTSLTVDFNLRTGDKAIMKNVAVFCASATPTNSIYVEEAVKLGKVLALKGIGVVYGGASIGLMNAVADAALKNGGKVTGVITEFLADKEISKTECSELIVTKTMAERKTKIMEISDGIITLPGGFGTMDELFETLTLKHLGLYKPPVGLLNVNGYFDALIEFMEKMVAEKFLAQKHLKILTVAATVEDLLNKMINE